MNPVFATAGKTQATPIWFVHGENFDSVRRDIGEHEPKIYHRGGF